jgi:hypothetical protein
MKALLPIKIELDVPAVERVAKSFDKLIKALQQLYKPFLIRKTGEADAHVELQHAKSKEHARILAAYTDAFIDDMKQYNLHRLFSEQEFKQLNIENIINKSVKYLNAIPSTEELPEVDWIADFFDMSQNVSKPEAQELWARLLAGEVDRPGSYSRRLMHAIKMMTAQEARFFEMICPYSVEVVISDEDQPSLNLSLINAYYQTVIVSIEQITLFESLHAGSFDYDMVDNLVALSLLSRMDFLYNEGEEDVAKKIRFADGDELLLKNADFSTLEFTALGKQLFGLCNRQMDLGYKKETIRLFKKYKMTRKK